MHAPARLFATVLLLTVACNRTAGSREIPGDAAADADVAADSAPAAPARATMATSHSDGPEPPDGGAFNDREESDDSGHPRPVVPLDPATAFTLGPDTVIGLRRTECLGTCPRYSVGIMADGTVHFYGDYFVAAPGYQTATIPRASVVSLLALLASQKFASLHARYFGMVTDNPSAIITLRQGGAMKRVTHDLSNHSEPGLAAIEKEIDRVAGTARWIGTTSPGALPGSPNRIPPIPEAAVARMAAKQIHDIEKTCSAGVTTKVTYKMRLSIDTLGWATPRGGGYKTGEDAIVKCVTREAANIWFPIASVYRQTDITFEVAP